MIADAHRTWDPEEMGNGFKSSMILLKLPERAPIYSVAASEVLLERCHRSSDKLDCEFAGAL
jgi:hypothetical protein